MSMFWRITIGRQPVAFSHEWFVTVRGTQEISWIHCHFFHSCESQCCHYCTMEMRPNFDLGLTLTTARWKLEKVPFRDMVVYLICEIARDRNWRILFLSIIASFSFCVKHTHGMQLSYWGCGHLRRATILPRLQVEYIQREFPWVISLA